MTVLSTASTQLAKYSQRPADEAYRTVSDLVAAAELDKQHSREVRYNWKDLRFRAEGADVRMVSPAGVQASLTHWSFGQVAGMLKSPAAYLRDGLSPQLAAQCLNYRIEASPVGSEAHLLVRHPNGSPDYTIRACNGKAYGRLWDADFYGNAEATVFQSRVNNGHSWQNAPIWGNEAGLAGFRSDRDSFVLRIDGGSIVTDPSAGSDNQLYRAILLGNSEVGDGSAWIDCILYRYICGNWNLWGGCIDSQFKRRHVGKNVLSDVLRELGTIARKWTERSASQDEKIIRGLIDHEIAQTKAGVIDELKVMGYTQEQAQQAYERCELAEKASPRSYWGIAQGTTRASQDSHFTDERYRLDELAAKVLTRGTKKYALAS